MEIQIKGKNTLYQWDTGQMITISGGDARYIDFTAPEVPEGVMRIEVVNGECPIPDVLLQTSGSRTIWVCLAGDTLVSHVLLVRRRPQPPDYVATPEQRVTFDALIQRASDTLGKAETAAATAKEAREALPKLVQLDSSQTASIAALSQRSVAASEYLFSVEHSCAEHYAFLLDIAKDFGVQVIENGVD